MTPAGTKWAATGAIIVTVAISLGVADRFLAKVESAEIKKTAQESYEKGSRLLAQGKAGDAVDLLSDAHALERENPDYELQLIAAMMATGKIATAEPILTDLLLRQPNDGPANLTAARLMVRKGDTRDAEAYYHRAIYGQWLGNSAMQRASARMELVDLLAARNQKQELLAELISLQAGAPATPAIQKRLAELFVLANAPDRAATVYAGLVQKNPEDIEAYEGLGDAELQQGQYRAARDVFLRASMREPDNGSIHEHLLTLDTVTGLDPTLRQLTSAEKYRRSIRILEIASEALDQCISKDAAAGATAGSDENRELLKTANATIAAKTPAHVTNEAAEGVLSLAEKLWRAESTTCERNSSDQNALELIMKKLQ